MGDSVAERISNADQDKRTLSEMIENNSPPGERILCISHSAYNMRMYEYFVRCFSILKNVPKAIIIPINIRSFSPQWYLQPEWQFEEEIRIIEDFLGEGNLKLNFKNKIDLINTPIYYPLTSLNSVEQFQQIINTKSTEKKVVLNRKRVIFTYHYTYKLDPNHELLKRMTNIVNLVRGHDIKLFFYVTPINYQTGSNLIGEQFTQINYSNLLLIKETLQNEDYKGIHFENYLELLSKEHFFNVDTATEHLNQMGRKQLASTISKDFNKFINNVN